MAEESESKEIPASKVASLSGHKGKVAHSSPVHV